MARIDRLPLNAIAFFVGLLLGLGICWWRQYRFKSQVTKMLTILPDTADVAASLPITSLVRRELAYLQQQTRQQAEQLQQQQILLDCAPIGYLLVDGDNQLLWCNQQAQNLLHLDRWQPGQVRLLLELVRSYDLDRLIERTRHSQTPQTQEWVFHPALYISQIPGQSGSFPLTVEPSLALKAFSYPLAQGQVAVFLENRQPLMELSRSRDRAFSDLTHELRTPLTSISLVAEALHKRLQDPEKRWIEQMLQEIKRLSELVQNWLDLSQLQENPSQVLCDDLIEIRELILCAWQSLDPLARQQQITLQWQGEKAVTLQGDRARLMQVFLNLLDNSIKHSPLKAIVTVELSLTTADGQKAPLTLQIDMIDCGSGFCESDLPYVFDRLYRGDPSRTRQGIARQGSGLGLAIAQEIIHAHGGSIVARNHPETGGAWVQVFLPLANSGHLNS